jgi:hypothetical protein
MSTRTTDAELRALLQRLNEATGSPLTYCAPRAEGVPFSSNVGHFHLYRAYGCTQLSRVHNTSGGVVTFGPLGTKRECADRIRAMLDGIELEREGGAQ